MSIIRAISQFFHALFHINRRKPVEPAIIHMIVDDPPVVEVVDHKSRQALTGKRLDPYGHFGRGNHTIPLGYTGRVQLD